MSACPTLSENEIPKSMTSPVPSPRGSGTCPLWGSRTFLIVAWGEELISSTADSLAVMITIDSLHGLSRSTKRCRTITDSHAAPVTARKPSEYHGRKRVMYTARDM